MARLDRQIERKHDRLDEMRVYGENEPTKLKEFELEQAAVTLLENRLELELELMNPHARDPHDQIKTVGLWKSAVEQAFKRRMVLQQLYALQARGGHPQHVVSPLESELESKFTPDAEPEPRSTLVAELEPELELELHVEPEPSDELSDTSGAGQSGSSTPNSRVFMTASERSAAGQPVDAMQLLVAPRRRHRLQLRCGDHGNQAADRADHAAHALEDFRAGKLKRAVEAASAALSMGSLDSRLWLVLLHCSFRKHQYDRTFQLLGAAEQAHPDNAQLIKFRDALKRALYESDARAGDVENPASPSARGG
jgi:hypothetical protein